MPQASNCLVFSTWQLGWLVADSHWQQVESSHFATSPNLRNVSGDFHIAIQNGPSTVDSSYLPSGWWLTYPSEKYEFVNWDDEIPNMMGKS